MPRTTSRLLVLCSTLILTVAAGCQSLGERSAPQTTAATTPGTATVEATPPATDTSAASTERIASARQQILEMGSGEFIAPATTAPAVAETSAGDITLNFQDTDLREFVKAVVGDLLGANYLIDPTVAGKVTIAGEQPKDKVRISFVNSSIGQGSGANVQPDGTYSLEQPLPLAEYTDFLTKIPEATDGPATTASEVLSSVAREYRSEEKSPLKFEVKEGSNQFDVEAPAPTVAKK